MEGDVTAPLRLIPVGKHADLEPFVADEAKSFLIGRSSRCDFRLPSDLKAASRVHAEIFNADGRWKIRNKSNYGTGHNHDKLVEDGVTVLRDGDLLHIGPCELRVHLERQEPGTELDGDHELTVSRIDFAELDTTKVLRFAIELPERLAETSDQDAAFLVACEFLVAALAPAVRSAHVIQLSPDGEEALQVAARARGPGGELLSTEEMPTISRRVLRRVFDSPDSVIFRSRSAGLTQLTQAGEGTEGEGATMDAFVRSVGACLLQGGEDGKGSATHLLYIVGDRRLAQGEPWIARSLGLVATLTRQHLRSLRRAALSKFFSPRVVRMLDGAAGQKQIEPRITTATSVFFDLRGFSSLVEAAVSDLHGVHSEIVEAMSIVTDAVFEHEGTVIDYLGDGVFAAWGVPFDQPEQTELAARCMLEVVRRVRSSGLRFVKRQLTKPGPICGVGLCVGDVLAGTVGSRKMFKYGIVGPSVNTAQRMESLTRVTRLDASILVTEEAEERLRGSDIQVRRVGRVQLAGMARVTAAFELVDPSSPREQSAKPEHEPLFAAALSALERARTLPDLAVVEASLEGLPEEHHRTRWLAAKLEELLEPDHLSRWDGTLFWAKS